MINGVVLSTDKIRKELIDKPNYNEQENKLIYDVLILLTKYLHNAGINCILDATFNSQETREDIKKRLDLTYDQYKIVECICPEELTISRLKIRKKAILMLMNIYKKIKSKYEPIEEKHITVDTSQHLKKIVTEIKNKIKNEF